MSSLQRRVGMLILLALAIQPLGLFAQGDASAVTVAGSSIPAPLVQAFATAANVPVTLNINGTNDGFASLCAGTTDITTATRPISADEETNCAGKNVNFLEFILGHDIMAVVANPATDFGECLTTQDLNALFAPSTTVANWNQVNTANADIPLSLYLPPDNTTPFALLDSLVEGVGLRSDANRVADDATIIDNVGKTPGAMGVVHLPEAQAAGAAVKILQLNTTSVGCTAPSAENVEGRSYTGAYQLYAYANSAQIDKVKPLFDAAFGADAPATVAAQGLVAPTEATYTTDRDILANNKTGRQFSKDVTAFNIPANLVGTININGSSEDADYMTALTGAFVKQYAGVTMNQKKDGIDTGVRSLCNGEIDLITDFAPLTADEQSNCAANNIPIETYNLGDHAVVVVGNGDFLSCLTTDELAKVWGATSEKTITNWNQVNSSFPDMPITLVATPVGELYGDILMLQATGQGLPTREDYAETKADPAYRIAAVGNVPGGMTYMSWAEYLALSDADKARAKVVEVDAGNGCVAPSEATFADGTYKLAHPLLVIVNRISMARQEVQSLLWYLASDENYPLLGSNGYYGLNFADLPALRDQLQKAFVQGQADAAAAATRAAEATPEATGEATAQATAETSVQATAEATNQATAEATDQATPETTPAATASS